MAPPDATPVDLAAFLAMSGFEAIQPTADLLRPAKALIDYARATLYLRRHDPAT